MPSTHDDFARLRVDVEFYRDRSLLRMVIYGYEAGALVLHRQVEIAPRTPPTKIANVVNAVVFDFFHPQLPELLDEMLDNLER